MDLTNLTKLPIEELRTLAVQHGIRPHHKTKAETLAKLIAEEAMKPKTSHKVEMQHPSQSVKVSAKANTEEEIREACKSFISKEGFVARFEDDIWHFSFNGAEDSGHMSVPLRIIKMKAENVSRGARKPTMMNFDGDKILAAG